MESEVIAIIEASNEKDIPADQPGMERKLELKICERCGGLWLRPAGSRWIYCGSCKRQVDELPPVSLKLSRKRKARQEKSTTTKPRSERVQ